MPLRSLESEPCSSTGGFIQKTPKLLDAFQDDTALRRLLNGFLPTTIQKNVDADIRQLAEKAVSPETLRDVDTADRNPPFVRTWDTWGNRIDEVVNSDSWKRLRHFAIEQGLVSLPYEGTLGIYGRIVQVAKLNVFSGSAGAVNFYTAFADGAAYLLRSHLERVHYDSSAKEMFRYAYDRLISRRRDYAWVAGLFMTERSGGSDVSGLETYASAVSKSSDTEPDERDADGFKLGPWNIRGFKWFSSGTESEIAFILARTDRGISLFYAPVYREARGEHGQSSKVPNGIKIQRLKRKIGTHPKPTAELEFDGVRAWLVGEEGQGILEVANVLNIGRIHVGTAALGMWARGLSIVKAFSRARKSGSRPLTSVAMYMNCLAKMHVEYRAHLALMFLVAGLLGRTEHPCVSDDAQLPGTIPQSMEDVQLLLRLLTPVAKVLAVEAAIAGLLQCMGLMGGVGFLENEETQFNIARIYRDATVCVVLDGTPNALIMEMMRVLKGKTGARACSALESWIHCAMPADDRFSVEGAQLLAYWSELQVDLNDNRTEDLMIVGHDVMKRIGALVSGVLLLADASRDADEVAAEVGRTWLKGMGTSLWQTTSKMAQDVLRMGQKIVFGTTF